MSDYLPCCRRLSSLECHLPLAHDGHHQALAPCLDGSFAEVDWADEYAGLANQPWLGELTADVDCPPEFAWVYYGPEGDIDPAWANS